MIAERRLKVFLRDINQLLSIKKFTRLRAFSITQEAILFHVFLLQVVFCYTLFLERFKNFYNNSVFYDFSESSRQQLFYPPLL